MKKIYLIAVILLILNPYLTAQKTKDVLYLKNGSKIFGNLIEITDNQYKLQTSDGSLFIYSIGEVEKYTKEAPEFKGRKKQGLGMALEGGFLAGAQSSQYPSPFSFIVTANYTIDTKNIFSIGSGAEFLGKTYTPLFFEFKRLISERKTTPFFFARGGLMTYLGPEEKDVYYYYPTSYAKKYSGGGTFTLGTGISWIKEDIETYLSFAYRYAQTSYDESSGAPAPTTWKYNYNRLEIKFGFKF